MKLKKGSLVHSLNYTVPDYCNTRGEVQAVRNGMLIVSFPFFDNPRKSITVIADERQFEKAETESP